MGQARIIEVPAVVPYFGLRPAWISSNRPMVITTTVGKYEASDGTVITVPCGFITDMASTPRAVWSLVPPHGDLILAAIPHDWGYAHGGRELGLPKGWWDVLFHDLLVITPKIPRWKVVIAYAAVSLFGRGGWCTGWCDYKPGRIPDWSMLGHPLPNERKE